MDRRISTEGFTLVEMCIAMLGISILACIFAPMQIFSPDGSDSFGDAYLLKQSEAIVKAQEERYVSQDGKEVDFNADGNVRRAETLSFPRKNRRIIIELGGGRLVYR